MKKPLYKKMSLSLILIILILLSSCKEGMEDIFVKMGLQTQSIPQIQGENTDLINQKLSDFYNEVKLVLNDSAKKGLDIRLEYVFAQNENGSSLKSWIEGGDDQKLFIDDIEIVSDDIDLPNKDFLKSISDMDFLKQCLNLSSNGYQINLSRLGEKATSQRLYAILALSYEDILEREIDFSSVNRPDIDDDLQLKALSILPDGVSQSSNEGLKPKDAGNAFSHLIKELLFYKLGLSNQNIFISDTGKFFDYYHQFYSVFASGHKNFDYWQDFKTDFNKLLSEGFLDEQNAAISRGELASLYSFIYSEYFHGQDNDSIYIDFIDCEDEDASFCVGQNLMNYFPKSPMFYPEYLCKYYELPLLINKFIETAFYDNFEVENDSIIFVTEEALIKSYQNLKTFITDLGGQNNTEVKYHKKLNDKSHLWYERQYNTGEYADVNCMPTMTAMAIKWADKNSKVKTEDIRNLFLPEFTGGWWMAQVIAALDIYEIPHIYTKLNKEMIVEILDRGKIVLVMFSEAVPDSQGHCEIIYGYEKHGDSLRFIVNDPGFENKYKADGSPYGKARTLDAEYLMWTAERMNKYMLALNTN